MAKMTLETAQEQYSKLSTLTSKLKQWVNRSERRFFTPSVSGSMLFPSFHFTIHDKELLERTKEEAQRLDDWSVQRLGRNSGADVWVEVVERDGNVLVRVNPEKSLGVEGEFFPLTRAGIDQVSTALSDVEKKAGLR